MAKGGQQTLERGQIGERPELPEIKQKPHPHLAEPKKLGAMQGADRKTSEDMLSEIRSMQTGKVTVGIGTVTGVFSVEDDKVYLEGAGITAKFSGRGVELYYTSRDGREERVPANLEKQYGKEIYKMLVAFNNERAKGRSDRITDLDEKDMKKFVRRFVDFMRNTDAGARVSEQRMTKDKGAIMSFDGENRFIGAVHRATGKLEMMNEDGDLEEVTDVDKRNRFEKEFRRSLRDPKVKKNFSKEEAEEVLERYSARTKEIEARRELARRSEALERAEERRGEEKRRKKTEAAAKERQREQKRQEAEAERLLSEKPENILTLDPKVRKRMEKRKSSTLIELYQQRPDLYERVHRKAA